MEKLRVLDLFSGIGGISLGLEATGYFKTVAFCEVDPFCVKVLNKHWPEVPVIPDVTQLANDLEFHPPTASDLGECVEVICGGFPCQDISYNGDGAGIEGARSGLWRDFARIIRALNGSLKYVIIENVAALRTRGLHTVLTDLAKAGLDAEWDTIPASLCGADHARERLFIIAYPQGQRMEGVWPQGFQVPRSLDKTVLSVRTCDGLWKVEPDVCRAVHGVSNRSHRLRALGNAVIPQIPYCIGHHIMDRERRLGLA